MADRARTPEALEREIMRTREELARTIDELAERVRPRNVAKRGVDLLKEEAEHVVAAIGAAARPTEDGEPRPVDKRVVAAGVGIAAVTVTAIVLWRRRRRR